MVTVIGLPKLAARAPIPTPRGVATVPPLTSRPVTLSAPASGGRLTRGRKTEVLVLGPPAAAWIGAVAPSSEDAMVANKQSNVSLWGCMAHILAMCAVAPAMESD